ncbi:LuxR C-terminal-related transcriptional regulator [Streptomyces anulatus]
MSRPRMPLTPRQAQVLIAAADGAPLSQVAERLGVRRETVAARLSDAYRRLDVAHLPRDEKRQAAVRTARRRGLIPA